jgi:hypothetical protein
MYWGVWVAVAISVDVLMAFIECLECTGLLRSTYVVVRVCVCVCVCVCG